MSPAVRIRRCSHGCVRQTPERHPAVGSVLQTSANDQGAIVATDDHGPVLRDGERLTYIVIRNGRDYGRLSVVKSRIVMTDEYIRVVRMPA